ncbi:MAG: hypothetical protein IH948_00070 [Bacteroidetes bacterium]|nr:hypothetical protein [Bacteroidota bacterium]
MNKCINCGDESNPISPVCLSFGDFCSMDCEVDYQIKMEEEENETK